MSPMRHESRPSAPPLEEPIDAILVEVADDDELAAPAPDRASTPVPS
jgi:hypothetical protein